MKCCNISLFFVLSVFLTLGTAYPRHKYRVYKKPKSQDVSTGKDTPIVPEVQAVTTESTGDVAAVIRTKVESPVSTANASGIPPEFETGGLTPEPEAPKIGEKPFGEPTKPPSEIEVSETIATKEPLAFPPAPETVKLVPSSVPVQPSPSSASTQVPSIVEPTEDPVPPSPSPVANSTSEEEDSSSEEDNEDEDEDVARKLLSKKAKKQQKKSRFFSFSPESDEDSTSFEERGRAGPPKNPPLKYDMIINGFVTEKGEVLVPLDTYQKYFHDSRSNRLPPVYAIYRQEDGTKGSGLSTSEVVSEEVDKDKSSEEAIPPVRISSTKLIYPDPVKPEVQESNEETSQSGSSVDSSEETSDKEVAVVDSEEKETPSSEASSPDTTNQIQPGEHTRNPPIRRPPPLQLIPARLPTGEDDEEDAGRFLDHIASPYPLDSNYYFDDIEENGFAPQGLYYEY